VSLVKGHPTECHQHFGDACIACRLHVARSGPQHQPSPTSNAWAMQVLLMDDTGALGLDLSFVSRVYLMEPLADAALEQQVRWISGLWVGSGSWGC